MVGREKNGLTRCVNLLDHVNNAWIMFKSTYSLEIADALIFVVPAALVTKFLKKSENIDVYDYDTNFNPFHFN